MVLNIETVRSIAGKILGSKNVSTDTRILDLYSHDMSFCPGFSPIAVTWPRNSRDVQKMVIASIKNVFSLLPVSSGPGERVNGDTIPKTGNCVMLDLSRLNKIIHIDRSNRVAEIQPGVTFSQLIPALASHGLRLVMPLMPRARKSVVASMLDREPCTIPRYQWDSSDPLLCVEVVFGNGNVFRTGSAAGPGSLKEQHKAGQAQVNPMGPTQFNPLQILQGAQGTLGIVTWATIKCETIPSIQKVYHISSKDLSLLIDIQRWLVMHRLCDEIFILNGIELAALLEGDKASCDKIAQNLPEWNLVFVLAGTGKLATDRIAYLEGDVVEYLENQGSEITILDGLIDARAVIAAVSSTYDGQWRSRLKGRFYGTFFITSMDQVEKYIAIAKQHFQDAELGVYIQLLNLGTSCHCEFDVFYNPSDSRNFNLIKAKLSTFYDELIESGAFFSRPHGEIAKTVFAHYRLENITALKKVKAIFDPHNIFNPGALCFEKIPSGDLQE